MPRRDRTRQEHSLGKKIKLHEMKNQKKNYVCFHNPKINVTNFKAFQGSSESTISWAQKSVAFQIHTFLVF